MCFCHIVDDFYLQGILGQLKQKKWWEENLDLTKYSLYRYDYIAALLIHSFSWSFLVHLPIFILYISNSININLLIISLLINMILHSIIDNLKANKLKINLLIDQSFHLLQIITIHKIFCK